ncbi:HET-domain-containing protein, partial [Amniculicola lignicola CBS 123094]
MNTHVVHDHSDVEDLEALYRQRPLPRNTKSIRLIDISSSSQFVSEIKGSLRVVDLDAEPHFTALSYVWGAMVPEPHHVNCGGFRIKITENGHCALRHLRKKLGNFTIWVDALCINQADVAEKSHQVPLMADIYSKAASVFVWLGESDAGLGLLLNRLPIISTWCMAKHATDADLRNLLLREWTTRMWTYQEIVLATHPIL